MIGLHGRGTDHAQIFARNPGAEVVAVCDVDESTFQRPIKIVQEKTGKAPRAEKDFRRLLDDKSIDAITIATPDHWHALMTVMACQAGKDVYVEKPVSHNVVEGRRMVEAARKYRRIVQAGTQRRSSAFVEEGISQVHAGAIGKVGMARAWIHQKRVNIGHGKPAPVPPGVDYALWQGPAPERPFYPNRFHYNWHWFWHWGTGELGNNGIHGLDVARWGLGVDAPLAVSSGGGKYVFDDDQEVPDTQIATWEFPTACLVWEHRMWSAHPMEGSGFGIAFYGDKGTLVIGEKSWRIEDGGQPAPTAIRAGMAKPGMSRTSSTASRVAQPPVPRSKSAISVPAFATLATSPSDWGVSLPLMDPVKYFTTTKRISCSRASTAAASRCRHRSETKRA